MSAAAETASCDGVRPFHDQNATGTSRAAHARGRRAASQAAAAQKIVADTSSSEAPLHSVGFRSFVCSLVRRIRTGPSVVLRACAGHVYGRARDWGDPQYGTWEATKNRIDERALVAIKRCRGNPFL
jgi:hypothetical protein